MSTEATTTQAVVNDETCKSTFLNLGGFLLSKDCKEYNKRKAGTGVATGSTAITSVEKKDLGSVPAAGAPIPAAAAASGNPAGPLPPTRGGWFSRGGKRRSKAKKSRRKNRKQRKSRKSRK